MGYMGLQKYMSDAREKDTQEVLEVLPDGDRRCPHEQRLVGQERHAAGGDERSLFYATLKICLQLV